MDESVDINKVSNLPLKYHRIKNYSTNTSWKVWKYWVFSGLFFPVFSPNTGKYGPEKFRIWTLFMQWNMPISVSFWLTFFLNGSVILDIGFTDEGCEKNFLVYLNNDAQMI